MQYWLDSRPIDDRTSCGDFAECFPLDSDRHAIIIADVAGRGAAAGAAARALLDLARIAVTSRENLRTGLTLVDDIFTHHVMSEDVPLASLFLAIADVKEGVLEYASAGHEPALHFTNSTRHDHLYPTGPLLGIEKLASPSFTQRRVHFTPESVLVAVTDGITESRRYERGMPLFFGSQGVARALVNALRLHEDPARAIADAAADHANGQTRDDATALVVELGQFWLSDLRLITRKQLPRHVQRRRHQPPANWMGELLVCSCGHGIGKRTADVCEGDLRRSCRCTLDPDSVLMAAIATARLYS